MLGLIQGKAKLDVKNSEGQTALMLACRNGWIPMIEFLVSAGEIINSADWLTVSMSQH